MKRIIDHIVYCVPDLAEGIDHFESLLGVRPAFGGQHKTKGTKNALLNLGNHCYLEILAIDDDNLNFQGDRWMGIDLLHGPKITRWALSSIDLATDGKVLANYSQKLGHIIEGSRETIEGSLLSWKMISPASAPEVELLPFMVDWSGSQAHPTDGLEEGCWLEHIYLSHPNPDEIKPALMNLGIDIGVEKSAEPRIEIEIKSPNGVTFIS